MPDYTTDTIAQQLAALGLPFASLIARSLVALLSRHKATVHHIAALLPGAPAQSVQDKRQELRRLLDQPALTQPAWAKAIAASLPKGKWCWQSCTPVVPSSGNTGGRAVFVKRLFTPRFGLYISGAT